MVRHESQLALPEIGERGQRAIARARVLVVGVGAIGSVAAELLCRAGVGALVLQDFDIVQESNLQRQALYTSADIGKHKAGAARAHLRAIDPSCAVEASADAFSAATPLAGIDLIVDGTDSLAARMLMNDAARKAGIPLVIASAALTRGVAFTATPGGPCWQCVALGKRAGDDCGAGVLGTATHAIASVEATMALRALVGEPFPDLVELDVWDAALRRARVARNPACEACAGRFGFLAAVPAITLCEGTGRMQARPSAPMRIALGALRASAQEDVIEDYGTALLLRLGPGTALVHQHGLVEFEGVDEAAARGFVARVTGSPHR